MTVEGGAACAARLEEFEGEVAGQRNEPSKTAGGEAGFPVEPQSESLVRIPACADGVARNESTERLISERTPQQGTERCRRIGRMPVIRLVRVHRAWSAVDSLEASNAAQSGTKERARCRTGRSCVEGALAGRRGVRGSHGRAAHRAAQEGTYLGCVSESRKEHPGAARGRWNGVRLCASAAHRSVAVRLLD